MPYTIFKSDGSVVVVPDNVIDNAYYNPNANGAGIGQGVQLIGQNAEGYGPAIAQNFLQLAENFASPAVPLDTTSLQGQLWFNTSTNTLYTKLNNNQTGGIANWDQIITAGNISGFSVPNITGGVANELVYQTGPSTTNFISPPASSNSVLSWNGTTFVWTTTPIIDGSNITAGTIPNSALQNSSITVTAGSGLSDGGTVALGGTITLTNAGITSVTNGGGLTITGTGGPTTFTGDITISTTTVSTETLQTVTTRGNTTTNSISITNNTNTSSAGALNVTGSINGSDLYLTGSLSLTSDSTFIEGDFSNTTVSNRVLVKTNNSANNYTVFELVPNGTVPSGTHTTAFNAGDGDTVNGNALQIAVFKGTDARILALARGTSTPLPLTFYTNNVEQMRLDINGNLGVHTVPNGLGKIDVVSGSATLSSYAITAGGNDTSLGITENTAMSGNPIVINSFARGNTGVAKNMVISSNGGLVSVGGSTTNSTLEVNGTLGVSSTNTYGLQFNGNQINSPGFNGVAEIAMNYSGYQGGLTQYRNFTVYDGKQGVAMQIIGANHVASFNSSGQTSTVTINDTGANGANLRLSGGGGTKYIRAQSNQLQVINNAYSAAIFILDDSGNGSFLGNVTAYYSDRRLKKNITPIKNALTSVMSLTGVRYKQAEIAEQFGYAPDDEVKVGVIAQEVQAVLPEAVKPAPFDIDAEGKSKSGENYLTVQYEKLVPLLIEAIKEQQEQIDSLTETLKLLSQQSRI